MNVEVKDQDQLRRYVAKQWGGQMTYQPRIPPEPMAVVKYRTCHH
ncbi:hypothetical protein [Photobacterium carnosum]|nr:hypothetical protein [Photobacterium carnosum]